jgi:hypothetical protein
LQFKLIWRAVVWIWVIILNKASIKVLFWNVNKGKVGNFRPLCILGNYCMIWKLTCGKKKTFPLFRWFTFFSIFNLILGSRFWEISVLSFRAEPVRNLKFAHFKDIVWMAFLFSFDLPRNRFLMPPETSPTPMCDLFSRVLQFPGKKIRIE